MQKIERSTRTTTRALALVVALALALMGCGGGSAGSGGSTPTSSTPTQPPSTPTAEPTEQETSEEPALDYYDDEVITFLIGVAPGDAVDTTARFWAEWLPRYLEGSPTIVVDNMPGGSHRLAMNHYELQVPRDGLTLMVVAPSGHSNWRFGLSGVEFDLAGWEPLLSSPGANVWYGNPDHIANVESLVEGDHEPLFFAGQQPRGGDLYKFLAWYVLGIDVSVTWGYDGRGPARVAFQQGESNVDVQSAAAYPDGVAPMVEAGEAVLLFTMGQFTPDGLQRDEFWTDIPHYGEVYEMMYGEPPSGEMMDVLQLLAGVQDTLGRVLYIHDDAPQEARDALNDAIERMVADPDFLAASFEALGPFTPVHGQAVRDLVQVSLLEVDDSLIDFVVDFVLEEFDQDLRE